jgi:transcriptional regulator with XRE-family HTH domain
VDKLAIGIGLSVLRKRHGLSAKQLSTMAGLPDYTVSRIETGKLTLMFIMAEKLLSVMHESHDELARVICAIEEKPEYAQYKATAQQLEDLKKPV